MPLSRSQMNRRAAADASAAARNARALLARYPTLNNDRVRSAAQSLDRAEGQRVGRSNAVIAAAAALVTATRTAVRKEPAVRQMAAAAARQERAAAARPKSVRDRVVRATVYDAINLKMRFDALYANADASAIRAAPQASELVGLLQKRGKRNLDELRAATRALEEAMSARIPLPEALPPLEEPPFEEPLSVFERLREWLESDAAQAVDDLENRTHIKTIELHYARIEEGGRSNVETVGMILSAITVAQLSNDSAMLDRKRQEMAERGAAVRYGDAADFAIIMQKPKDFYLFVKGAGSNIKLLFDYTIRDLRLSDLPPAKAVQSGDVLNVTRQLPPAPLPTATTREERESYRQQKIARMAMGTGADTLMETLVKRRRRIAGGFCPWVILNTSAFAQNPVYTSFLRTVLFVHTEPSSGGGSSYNEGIRMFADRLFNETTFEQALEQWKAEYKAPLLIENTDKYIWSAPLKDLDDTNFTDPELFTKKDLAKLSGYALTICKMQALAKGDRTVIDLMYPFGEDGERVKPVPDFEKSLRGTMASMFAVRHFARTEVSRTTCFLNAIVSYLERMKSVTGEEHDPRLMSFLESFVHASGQVERAVRVSEVNVLLKTHDVSLRLYKYSDERKARDSKLYGSRSQDAATLELCCVDNHYFPMFDFGDEWPGIKDTLSLFLSLRDSADVRKYTAEELIKLPFGVQEAVAREGALKRVGGRVAMYTKAAVPSRESMIEFEVEKKEEKGADEESSDDEDAKKRIRYVDIVTYDTETYNHEETGYALPILLTWCSVGRDIAYTNEMRAHLEDVIDLPKTVPEKPSLESFVAMTDRVPLYASGETVPTAEDLDFRRRAFAIRDRNDVGGAAPFFAWLVNRYGVLPGKNADGSRKEIPIVLLGAHNSTFDLGPLIAQKHGRVMRTCEFKGKNVTCTFSGLLGKKSLRIKLVDTYRIMPSSLASLSTGQIKFPKEQCIYNLYNHETVGRLETMPVDEFRKYVFDRHLEACKYEGINERLEKFSVSAYLSFCERWGAFANPGVINTQRPLLAYGLADSMKLGLAWIYQSMMWSKLFPKASRTLFELLSVCSYSNRITVDYGCLDGVARLGGLTGRFFQAGCVGGRTSANSLITQRDPVTKRELPFEWKVDDPTDPMAGVDCDQSSAYPSAMYWGPTCYPQGKPEHIRGEFPMSLYDFMKLPEVAGPFGSVAYQIEVELADAVGDDTFRLQFPSVSVLRDRETGAVIKDPLDSRAAGAWRDWTNEDWGGTRHSWNEVEVYSLIVLHEASKMYLKKVIVHGGMVFPSRKFNRNIAELMRMAFNERLAVRKPMKRLKLDAESAEERGDNAERDRLMTEWEEREAMQLTLKTFMCSAFGTTGQAIPTTTSVICRGDAAVANEYLKAPSECIRYSVYGRDERETTYLLTKAVGMDKLSGTALRRNSNRAQVFQRITAVTRFVVGAVLKCIQLLGFQALSTDTDSIQVPRAAMKDLPKMMATKFPQLWANEADALNTNMFLSFHSDFAAPKLHKSVPKVVPEGRVRETVATSLIRLGKKAYQNDLHVIEYDKADPFNRSKTTVLPLAGDGCHVRQLGIPLPCVKLTAKESFGGSIPALYRCAARGTAVEFDQLAACGVRFQRTTPNVERLADEKERKGWVMKLVDSNASAKRTISYAPEGFEPMNMATLCCHPQPLQGHARREQRRAERAAAP